MSEKRAVLMVCLGNICRSPIAEAVLQHLINEAGISSKWTVDSAAVAAYHIGKKPDRRALETLAKHNVPYNNTARQVKKSDFEEFDYIFGMDNENISDLESIAPKNCKAKIGLLGAYDPQKELIIRDPYYGNAQKIDLKLEKYYAVFYDVGWFIGRIVQAGEYIKLKFLKEDLGRYLWRRKEDL
ncbi:hypothetical protein HHI36_022476 [Cryptolaemus montrouzieri]|uniref:Low molecular weight phosphotyrosine protein phosphatase n=1 Tax=Cryptolaemus montrouzieri TaxID=559131 RepID=A0ABD2N042_9CUCU